MHPAHVGHRCDCCLRALNPEECRGKPEYPALMADENSPARILFAEYSVSHVNPVPDWEPGCQYGHIGLAEELAVPERPPKQCKIARCRHHPTCCPFDRKI